MATAILINPHTRGTTGRKATTTTKGNTMAKANRTTARKATTARKSTTTAKPRRAKARRPETVIKYRRNPLPARAKGIVAENIKPAAIGAAGALALDVIVAKLPIPASLKTGPASYAARAVGAIALGMIAEKVGKLKHEHAVSLARGGLTVVMHDAGKALMRAQFPALALAAYEEELTDIAGMVEGLENLAVYDQDLTDNGLENLAVYDQDLTVNGLAENYDYAGNE